MASDQAGGPDGGHEKRIADELRAEFGRDFPITRDKLFAIVALPGGVYLLYLESTYWYIILPIVAVLVLPGAARFYTDWKKPQPDSLSARFTSGSSEEIELLILKARLRRKAYLRSVVMLLFVSGIMAILTLRDDYVATFDDPEDVFFVLAFTLGIVLLIAAPSFLKGWKAHTELRRLEKMNRGNQPIDRR